MKLSIIGNQAFSLINFRGALIEDLVGRGHRVYALAPDIGPEAAQALVGLGAVPIEIDMARTSANPVADLRTLLSLRKALGRIKPDVSLTYAAKPNIYGTLAAWLSGVPRRFAMIEGLGYIFIVRPNEAMSKRLLRNVVITLFRFALRKVEKVFFLNPDDIADFAALGLVRPDQAINIGGIGVDLLVWQPAPPVVEPVTFIFVGRLLKDKGVLDFVAAAKEIKSVHPAARFLLVGDIDENPESVTTDDVETWVEAGLLEWSGHVPVAPWLERSSVFVLPSYREGVPRSTQEAMAMARPVITTNSVGCRETVVDGLNGFLVPSRDPQALSQAMQKFIEMPDLIVTMGAESRKLAEARFDVRKVNAVMIAEMDL